PAFALLAPSPYTEQASGLTKHRKPAFRPASPLRTGRRFPCLCPPLVPGTHAMELRPSSVPLRVPLPPPPASPLPAVPEFESHRARAADPTVSCPLATAVSDPSFESTVASALVAELSASPPSVKSECALGTDVLENRQEDFECLTAAVPRFASMLLAPEGDPDAPDIPTPRSYAEAITDTYVDAVPPSRANIVDGMWIFKVKRPPAAAAAATPPLSLSLPHLVLGGGEELGGSWGGRRGSAAPAPPAPPFSSIPAGDLQHQPPPPPPSPTSPYCVCSSWGEGICSTNPPRPPPSPYFLGGDG
ncbi:unnamed protein product, partial [Closterium sp. NIES-53]